VNEDRDLEAGRGFPDGIEFGIVHPESRAVLAPGRESEPLADFSHPAGAEGDVGGELVGQPLAVTGLDDTEIEGGEDGVAVGVARGRHRFQLLAQPVAAGADRLHHQADADLVELRAHAIGDLGGQQRRRVTVHVHHRELRSRRGMLRYHQR
jgi:hypothetical protein